METEITGHIGVEEIRDGTAILKDGSMIAVLEITPIDFDSMGASGKKRVIRAYRAWIESLDYPVQIAVINFNADIKEQAAVLKNSVEYSIKQKEEFRDLLKEYKQFEEWLDDYLKKNTKNGTVYYLAVPYFPARKPKWPGIFSKSKANEKLARDMEMLNSRVNENIMLLEETGVKAHRLTCAQLRNLYMSYFNITNKTGSNGSLLYSSPENWFDEFKKGVKTG